MGNIPYLLSNTVDCLKVVLEQIQKPNYVEAFCFHDGLCEWYSDLAEALRNQFPEIHKKHIQTIVSPLNLLHDAIQAESQNECLMQCSNFGIALLGLLFEPEIEALS